MVKMADKIDRSIYWKGALLAFLLFIFSLLIGYYIELDKTERIKNTINSINLAIDSSSTMMFFIQQTKSKKDCQALSIGINELWMETNRLRNQLEEQNTNVMIKNDELKTFYYLTNIKLFLLTRDYQDVCQKNFSNILFFYTAFVSCPECSVQGKILDEIRDECKGSVAVFAFPIDVKNIIALNLIQSYYNITKVPSLVINEKKYEGLLSKNEIKKIISC
jgi:hypothetical protein